MYKCMYVAVMFRNVENTYRNAVACKLRACGSLSGCLPFFCHECGARFSTLKITGRICDAIKLKELEQLHVEPNSE